MKIRWIDTSCFEIETDEKEIIVTDPYIDECENHPISSDEINAMDYILISHTHFDHITQLDKYYQLYKPKILCSRTSSIELLKTFDLSGQCMFGMDHLENLDFGNTSFTRISAKHSIPSRKERHLVRESEVKFELPDGLDEKYLKLNISGYTDFSNFYIETKNNTRILFWGGGLTIEQINQAKQFRPDIILMQIPSNPNSEIIKLIQLIGASWVIPHHHDTYLKTKNVDKMMEELKKEIETNCPSTQFINLQSGKWYQFNKTIIKE